MSTQEAMDLVDELAAGDPRAPGWFQYAVQLRASRGEAGDAVTGGGLIGDVGVNLHDNVLQADIGFTFSPTYQGRGYASEAVSRIVDHLFARGLRRISAECDARNTRSARLLERVGFTREGLRRQHTWIKGEWTDDLLFGLLADDERPSQSGGVLGRS